MDALRGTGASGGGGARRSTKGWTARDFLPKPPREPTAGVGSEAQYARRMDAYSKAVTEGLYRRCAVPCCKGDCKAGENVCGDKHAQLLKDMDRSSTLKLL